MYNAVEGAWLHFLHLHAGCTGFLRREFYLVGVGALCIAAAFCFFGSVVVTLGFLGVVMVMIVVEMVVRLTSASGNARHEDC